MVPVDRSLVVRPYARQDLSPVCALVSNSVQAHIHLDWQTIEEYLLTDPPYLWVAYTDGRLAGVIGFSRPIDGSSWLRVVSVRHQRDMHTVQQSLWEAALDVLQRDGLARVWAMVMHEWVYRWLVALEFRYIEQIVTLTYQQTALPPPPPSPTPDIRVIELADVPQVHRIDQSAFPPPWRLSLADVRLGVRVGSYRTIVMRDQQMIGYQIATTHGLNGHLARLGVLPDYQGQGVGKWLVYDMIRRFHQREINFLSVNTQESNRRSQRVYEQFGFRRNGYDLPVWMLDV